MRAVFARPLAQRHARAEIVVVLRIHRQIHGQACIAASACSVLDALGIPAPAQETLDALVQAGMRAGRSGFASLADALRTLALPCAAVRCTPAASELVRWIEETPGTSEGFLVSHHVRLRDGRTGAHVTVVFRADGGWRRADPSDASIREVALLELARGYAGDVALVRAAR